MDLGRYLRIAACVQEIEDQLCLHDTDVPWINIIPAMTNVYSLSVSQLDVLQEDVLLAAWETWWPNLQRLHFITEMKSLQLLHLDELFVPRLKNLDVVCNSTYEHLAVHGEGDIGQLLTVLSPFIASCQGSLESLRLFIHRPTASPFELSSFIDSLPQLPLLKSLYIRGVFYLSDGQSFGKFLCLHSETLVHLTIHPTQHRWIDSTLPLLHDDSAPFPRLQELKLSSDDNNTATLAFSMAKQATNSLRRLCVNMNLTTAQLKALCDDHGQNRSLKILEIGVENLSRT